MTCIVVFRVFEAKTTKKKISSIHRPTLFKKVENRPGRTVEWSDLDQTLHMHSKHQYPEMVPELFHLSLKQARTESKMTIFSPKI